MTRSSPVGSTESPDPRRSSRTAGYYSVIRYIPDLWRGESVNLGVLLFVPARRFLVCELTDDYARACRFFPGLDIARTRYMASSLVEQLDRDRDRLLNRGRLGSFMLDFQNQMQFAPLRIVLVDDNHATLSWLYSRLVETYDD